MDYDKKQYFDINTGATILGVNPITLRRAIKDNRMTYKVVMENYQKKYLVSYDDLNTYITYCAKNNIYSLDQLKKIKDRLNTYQKNKGDFLINSGDNTLYDKDDDAVYNNTQSSNDYIIELFKQQENFIDNKIKQYEEKIENANKIIEVLKIENITIKSELEKKDMQLGLSVKKNAKLNEDINFFKNNIDNNLNLIKDLLNKIKVITERHPIEKVIEKERIIEKPINTAPQKIVYMDIINF